jgi:hypothetical protein
MISLHRHKGEAFSMSPWGALTYVYPSLGGIRCEPPTVWNKIQGFSDGEAEIQRSCSPEQLLEMPFRATLDQSILASISKKCRVGRNLPPNILSPLVFPFLTARYR